MRDEFVDADTVRTLLTEPDSAELDPADIAIVQFAEKIAVDPTTASQADIDALRDQGLSDEEVFHVVLAVTARRFFAGTLAAVGELEDAAAALLP